MATEGMADFLDSYETWSLCAFEAPIDRVAEVLKKRADVVEYEAKVKAFRFGNEMGISRERELRRVYCFQEPQSEWTVLAYTIEDAKREDVAKVDAIAANASASLAARTVAGRREPGKDSELTIFEKGKKKSAVKGSSAIDEWAASVGLGVPPCFISFRESFAGPHVQKFHINSKLTRLDRLVMSAGDAAAAAVEKKPSKPAAPAKTMYSIEGECCLVTDPDGVTIQYDLGAAAGAGESKVVELLIKAGADVNQQNEVGETPLHQACSHAKLETAKILVAHGADVEIEDQFGSSARSFAAADATGRLAKALGIGKSGTKTRLNDRDRRVAAEIVVGELCDAVSARDRKTVTRLIRGGLAAPALNEGLEAAVAVADASLIKLLVEADADPSGPPLILAAGRGDLETVRLLLELGANPRTRGEDGETALECANAAGHAEVADVLKKARKR